MKHLVSTSSLALALLLTSPLFSTPGDDPVGVIPLKKAVSFPQDKGVFKKLECIEKIKKLKTITELFNQPPMDHQKKELQGLVRNTSRLWHIAAGIETAKALVDLMSIFNMASTDAKTLAMWARYHVFLSATHLGAVGFDSYRQKNLDALADSEPFSHTATAVLNTYYLYKDSKIMSNADRIAIRNKVMDLGYKTEKAKQLVLLALGMFLKGNALYHGQKELREYEIDKHTLNPFTPQGNPAKKYSFYFMIGELVELLRKYTFYQFQLSNLDHLESHVGKV